MDDAIEKFAAYMQAENLAVGSIKTRLSHLKCLQASLPFNLLRADHGDLVAYMSSRDVAAETQRVTSASIRKFYGWAHDEGLIESNPARRLPSIKSPKSMPKPIPENLLAVALANADQETRLMLVLGSYAGLRRAEIAGLHRDDITHMGLRITGKGGRTRLVPIHPIVRDALERWENRDGWLFPSPVFKDRPVTPDYVSNRMETALPPGYSCHKLRHRFATRTYAHTHDLFAVQHLLGHSSPETTSRYVLVPEDSLKAAVFSIE